MSQITQLGEAELDSYIKIARADGTTEYYRVLNGANTPLSAAQYEQATEGQN